MVDHPRPPGWAGVRTGRAAHRVRDSHALGVHGSDGGCGGSGVRAHRSEPTYHRLAGDSRWQEQLREGIEMARGYWGIRTDPRLGGGRRAWPGDRGFRKGGVPRGVLPLEDRRYRSDHGRLSRSCDGTIHRRRRAWRPYLGRRVHQPEAELVFIDVDRWYHEGDRSPIRSFVASTSTPIFPDGPRIDADLDDGRCCRLFRGGSPGGEPLRFRCRRAAHQAPHGTVSADGCSRPDHRRRGGRRHALDAVRRHHRELAYDAGAGRSSSSFISPLRERVRLS